MSSKYSACTKRSERAVSQETKPNCFSLFQVLMMPVCRFLLPLLRRELLLLPRLLPRLRLPLPLREESRPMMLLELWTLTKILCQCLGLLSVCLPSTEGG